MGPDMVVNIWREALFLVVTLVAVAVLPSLLVGLVVSTFQAATQINEQTLSFLPRLLTMLMVVIITGPWLLRKVLEFTEELILAIPYLVG